MEALYKAHGDKFPQAKDFGSIDID
jgi:hypothetical protein